MLEYMYTSDYPEKPAGKDTPEPTPAETVKQEESTTSTMQGMAFVRF